MTLQDLPKHLDDPHAQARILAQALPYMQKYAEETVVIKYGGNAMGDEEASRRFAQDVTLLNQATINPVVVHGGGPQIGAMLDRLQIKSEFAAGLRVTDRAAVDVVEMVLAGSINKALVMAINRVGGRAVGLSGKDASMVLARRATRTLRDPDTNRETLIDLGFVGDPVRVDRTLLDVILGKEIIPVVAPVAFGDEGETLNVNADTFAGALAGALGAKRFLLLTDVPGVLDGGGRLIDELSIAECRRMIQDGIISGGMIPKVETCIYALEAGVEAVVIVDGRVPHSVLLELLTDHGAGTLIRQ